LFTYMVGDPGTFKKAMNCSDAPFWMEVINSEISSIMENNLDIGGSTSWLQTY